MGKSLNLNRRAHKLVQQIVDRAGALNVKPIELPGGARGIDFGIEVEGGLEAGKWLARACMADLGRISYEEGNTIAGKSCPIVRVRTNAPVHACMAAQYAGWQISAGDYFAIGSGPMRAIVAEEEVYEKIDYSERSEVAVGVLETRKLPTKEVIEYLCSKLKVSAGNLTLLIAPTASVAGGFQVVARSVETALHKLVEIDFDINQVTFGEGTAPLSPVPLSDMAAIGWTNDAILYGADVRLRVSCSDTPIERAGPLTPSSASEDYGEPFGTIFKKYNYEFYQIDKLLFSPARITFKSETTNNEFTYGDVNEELLEASFGGRKIEKKEEETKG
jgi:methenyltetrahydromethanopterin cyclohydrolase